VAKLIEAEFASVAAHPAGADASKGQRIHGELEDNIVDANLQNNRNLCAVLLELSGWQFFDKKLPIDYCNSKIIVYGSSAICQLVMFCFNLL